MFLSGIFLFRRRTSSWSDAVKLGGLSTSFLSLLGLIHFFQGGNLKKVADVGEGGGYVGYALATLFGTLAGDIGGTILFLTFFLVGTIAALNVSLLRFSDGIGARLSAKGKTEEESNEEAQEEPVPNVVPVEEAEANASPEESRESPVSDPLLHRENIKRIHFPDESAPEASPSEKTEGLTSVPAYFLSSEPSVAPALPRRAPMKRHRFWQLPPLDLLDASDEQGFGGDTAARAEVIRQTLMNFGIEVIPKEIKEGPSVTQYTFSPASGVKISRITTLHNDLALALAAPSIRIEAPIPGRALLGIEVPNTAQAIVRLRSILESPSFVKRPASSSLTIALGKDVYGEYAVSDLARMPHLLVAGATNSGKSIFINSLLLSLLYHHAPENLQLVLIDPKRVELSLYNGIPHLITDVIVDSKKVVNALRSMVGEMERRYKLLQEVGSRDIASYHARSLRGEKREISLPGGGSREEELPKLPYIVIVIDEMADLMMAHGREVEAAIVRLAQMARAVGIHLVLATQRPSVEVITGLIKANIVSRVAFQVATQIDSRTILDQSGAEKLLGRGDMLFTTAGLAQPRRLQGALVTEEEIANVVEFLREQKVRSGYEEPIGETVTKTNFPEREFAIPTRADSQDGTHIASVVPESNRDEPLSDEMVFSLDDTEESGDGERDPRYEDAKRVVLEFGRASTSFLQRRMGLGYSRAAKLIDLLEQEGVIGPADGSKPREVFAAKNGSPSSVSSRPTAPEVESESSLPEKRFSSDDQWQV
ncbi:MAG: DNA translocase FtsK [Candidatus Moraniibacteriota bacterium]|nr:MAG: DNA translocase FtsK [Candidatus Moranbacteria bacterium]